MNKFAGYSYRSAEGILEAVKPVLKKYGVTILLSDDIQEVGGRVYVRATAWFIDPAEKENMKVTVTAYAREAEDKKGLDQSQITGTASSYARKYALNGLLLIDDTKDPDTDEYARQTSEKQFADPDAKISVETVQLIQKMAVDAKVELKTVLSKPVEELTNKQAGSLMQSLKKRITS